MKTIYQAALESQALEAGGARAGAGAGAGGFQLLAAGF